jgi:hypothetical protein
MFILFDRKEYTSSISESMFAVHKIAVFCSSLIACFPCIIIIIIIIISSSSSSSSSSLCLISVLLFQRPASCLLFCAKRYERPK